MRLVLYVISWWDIIEKVQCSVSDSLHNVNYEI